MNEEAKLFGKCPYVTSQKLIAGKWSMLILHHLNGNTLRFGELQRKIPGLTQTTLTKQLRILESTHLIHREVYPEVPPKVEYSLTEMGKEFEPVLSAYEAFGNKYIEYLKNQT